MIRKLMQKDHEIVQTLLQQEPTYNLFIIGDIEAYGYESEFQELWGDFTTDGNLRAVLLRYHQSFIPYGKGNFDVEGFVSCIKDYSVSTFSGKTNIIEKFERLLPVLKKKKRIDTYFCECRNVIFPETQAQVQVASLQEVDQIMNLREKIKEFYITKESRTMLIQSIEKKTGRTYYIEVDGNIVSCASTAAENSQSAMIVGVCTDSGFRKKGFASSVVEKIIVDLITEGKTLCLFYDNPAAGRIYKQLGFKDIGMWTMYR